MQDFDDEAEKRQRKEFRLQRAVQRLAPEEHYEIGSSNQDSVARPTSSSNPLVQHVVASKSHDRLERRRASSVKLISDYLIATDKKENARRLLGQKRSKERNQAKRRSDNACRALEVEISSCWDACATEKSAWDTKEALEKQQTRCTALIKAKEDLLQDYSFFRRFADDDYSASLKDHADTLDALKQSVESELLEMQQLFEQELDTIEEAFVDDRARLLESNRDEIANLILEKSHLQLHFIQSNHARRDGDLDDIHAQRARSREEYAQLKASLEEQVYELEKKLEQTKSSHQMNSDKLNYNLRILLQRNEEAATIIKKQKKRLVQSKAGFNESRDRYWEAKKRGDKQITALSKDCKALDARNKGLRTKSRRFEMNDEGKYQALLDMHIEELSMLADKTKGCENEITCILRGKGSSELDLSSETGALGPIDDELDEEGILDKLSSTINASTYRGWVALEGELEAYKDVLDDRRRKGGTIARIVDDSHKVERQMKTIAASDNATELLCPPTMFLQATKL